jgi:CheY-like chemotaxis protein
VSLPLLRGANKHPDSVATNTPRSISSFGKEADDSIAKLRTLVTGQRVSLHGFDPEVEIPEIQKTAKLFKNSVINFLTHWYGMIVVPSNHKASIIISNEGSVAETSKLMRNSIKQWKINPTVVVLCSHSSRFDRTAAEVENKLNIGYVSKPIGPLKLGRAIAQSFETSRPVTPGMLEIPPTPESNDLSNVFEEMTLSAKGGEVLDNSRMAADSENARKAIESPTPNAGEKRTEFPFPPPISKAKPLADLLVQPPSHDIALASEERPSLVLRPITAVPTRKPPSFLLVDDNAINLALLNTSISKRKNDVIDQAMDGLAAVNKFQERQEGYDIIFMDISMPLLDGFGATKEIRNIEEGRKARATEDKVPFTPALVIALTGLASNEDQARAAKVGVDLFLTKPVSFKDVKKMLDNWEANREKDSM